MRWPAAVMLPPEPDALLDRFASLAARTLRAPMAVLSLLDDSQQVVLPGAAGMPEPWQRERTMQWAHSLCRFVAGGTGLVAVDDVATDPHASDYAEAVDAFGVRSWIAAPLRFSHDFTHLFDTDDSSTGSALAPPSASLHSPEQLAVLDDVAAVLEIEEIHDIGEARGGGGGDSGNGSGSGDPRDDQLAPASAAQEHPVTTGSGRSGEQGMAWGVLCVLDTTARQWTERDRELIEDLAAAAAAELRSRVLTSRAIDAERRMATTLATAQAIQTRSQLLLSLSRGLAQAETVQDISTILTSLLHEQLDVQHFGLLLNDSEHHRARFVDMSTFPTGTDPAWATFDLRTATAPAARAITEGRALFCNDRDAVHALDPRLGEQGAWEYPGAVVFLPLHGQSPQSARSPRPPGSPGSPRGTLGALVLVWAAPATPLTPLTRHCGGHWPTTPPKPWPGCCTPPNAAPTPRPCNGRCSPPCPSRTTSNYARATSPPPPANTSAVTGTTPSSAPTGPPPWSSATSPDMT